MIRAPYRRAFANSDNTGFVKNLQPFPDTVLIGFVAQGHYLCKAPQDRLLLRERSLFRRDFCVYRTSFFQFFFWIWQLHTLLYLFQLIRLCDIQNHGRIYGELILLIIFGKIGFISILCNPVLPHSSPVTVVENLQGEEAWKLSLFTGQKKDAVLGASQNVGAHGRRPARRPWAAQGEPAPANMGQRAVYLQHMGGPSTAHSLRITGVQLNAGCCEPAKLAAKFGLLLFFLHCAAKSFAAGPWQDWEKARWDLVTSLWMIRMTATIFGKWKVEGPRAPLVYLWRSFRPQQNLTRLTTMKLTLKQHRSHFSPATCSTYRQKKLLHTLSRLWGTLLWYCNAVHNRKSCLLVIWLWKRPETPINFRVRRFFYKRYLIRTEDNFNSSGKWYCTSGLKQFVSRTS